MVTLYTASLTFNNSTFCPHSVFMCFVWIWEQTAIISLYSINWLVFITETECVYCAVWTGYLSIVQVNLKSLIAEAVSRRPLTAGAQVRSQASTHEICGRHGGTGTDFSPGTSVPPVSTIPPTLHTHLHLHDAVTRRTNGRSLGIFIKQWFFWNRGALDRNVHSPGV